MVLMLACTYALTAPSYSVGRLLPYGLQSQRKPCLRTSTRASSLDLRTVRAGWVPH